MAVNLLEEYGGNNKKTNLLEEYGSINQQSSNLNKISDPMNLARIKISQQYPGMPEWLREGLLSISPKEESPLLGKIASAAENVSSAIPDVSGGLLQGASIPIRGIASFIPNDYAQKLANSPDLSELFHKKEGIGHSIAGIGGELAGGGGLLGKIFQGAKYASQAAKVPKALQGATSLGASGAIASPGGIEEKTKGALGALALGAAGKSIGNAAGKIPGFARGLLNKPSSEEAVKAIQKPYDKMLSIADEQYGQVKNAINKRGIKLPVNEEYLNKARDILSKTRANEKLIEAAKSGDYDAVHNLQSHLFKKGTKGLSSSDLAVEKQGEEILELRDKINKELEDKLLREGHTDIAHVLKQGKKTYAKLMDTYFGPNLRKSIGKMVHHDIRLVPENPLDMFKENSVPMKAFLDKHPEVLKQLKSQKEKDEAMKILKGLGWGTVAGGSGAAGAKSIYDMFK